MDDDNWIDAKQRKPEKADSDAYSCILAYHRYNGAMVTGWHQIGVNTLYTHWMPLPPPPRCYSEISAAHKK